MLLILCCAFYLLWWCVAFRPGYHGGRVLGLLIPAVAAGLAGVVYSVVGMIGKGGRPALFPARYIIIGAAALYVVFMLFSSLVFRRKVTTELFLIIGWLMLEIISYQTAYRMEVFGAEVMKAFIAAAFAAAALSLYFYMRYYSVSETRGYIYGMIPLVITALCMAVFLAVCAGKAM